MVGKLQHQHHLLRKYLNDTNGHTICYSLFHKCKLTQPEVSLFTAGDINGCQANMQYAAILGGDMSFFTADILACQSKKSTGVTCYINNVLFQGSH